MRPLRVVHLVDGPIRYDHLSLIADHADRSAVELTFGSLSPRGPLHDDADARGIESFSLDATRRADYPNAVRRLAARLRRDRVDVLQTHLFEAQLVGLSAGRLARTPLLVMTAHHSHELPLLGQRLPLLADRAAARLLSHHVIAPSAQMADTLARVHGVRPGKVAVVPHGFAVDEWAPSADARQRVRAELDVAGRVLVGAVGRMHWIKGYETLLDAFAEVAAARPEVVLAIVGGGDASHLVARADALGIGDRVQLLGHRWDVPDVMDAFDLFVHPARAESFGLVIAEAMAKAKPVVSTRVGIAPDLVTDAGGRVVPTDDPAALASALGAVLDQPDAWAAMGEVNRARVSSMRAEPMVARIEELYRLWLDDR